MNGPAGSLTPKSRAVAKIKLTAQASTIIEQPKGKKNIRLGGKNQEKKGSSTSRRNGETSARGIFSTQMELEQR